MLNFDLHLKNPNITEVNTAFVTTYKVSKNKSLEIMGVTNAYSWFKISFSISRNPWIILGLCTFVICFKIKENL